MQEKSQSDQLENWQPVEKGEFGLRPNRSRPTGPPFQRTAQNGKRVAVSLALGTIFVNFGYAMATGYV
jgi:hypothetical protein